MRTLNYFNEILRTWKNGVRWTVRSSMLRNAKLWKFLGRNNHWLQLSSSTTLRRWNFDEFRDLGVITDHHLTWNSQVKCVLAKANRMLALIKRTCKGLNDQKTLRTLACSLAIVRSNLEYCFVVWSLYSRNNLDKLHGVQRWAFLRFYLFFFSIRIHSSFCFLKKNLFWSNIFFCCFLRQMKLT